MKRDSRKRYNLTLHLTGGLQCNRLPFTTKYTKVPIAPGSTKALREVYDSAAPNSKKGIRGD